MNKMSTERIHVFSFTARDSNGGKREQNDDKVWSNKLKMADRLTQLQDAVNQVPEETLD